MMPSSYQGGVYNRAIAEKYAPRIKRMDDAGSEHYVEAGAAHGSDEVVGVVVALNGGFAR